MLVRAPMSWRLITIKVMLIIVCIFWLFYLYYNNDNRLIDSQRCLSNIEYASVEWKYPNESIRK